jgi:hypothetical protein
MQFQWQIGGVEKERMMKGGCNGSTSREEIMGGRGKYLIVCPSMIDRNNLQ